MSYRSDMIRDELLALRDGNGLINARSAVEWARERPNSALHGSLNWNDQEAAEHYRVSQVRHLVAIYVETDSNVRSFVSLTIDRTNGGYRLLSDIAERVDLRERMLADALAELERVRTKYELVQELAAVWKAADEARERAAAKPKPSTSRSRGRGAARRAA